MTIKVKRIYDAAEKSDGFRVLVDRIWPRGLTKEKAKVDSWMKEVAPSTGLRKWFKHDPARWDEFRKRYRNELRNNEEFKNLKKEAAKHRIVTLLFGAKDEEHNNAAVLCDALS